MESDARPAKVPRCRHCGVSLSDTVVDLGSSPLCNTLLDSSTINAGERFYPLHARVCGSCFLVQLDEFVTPDEIFAEYSYFSSFSDSFVAHARDFVSMAIERFGLGPDSNVIEVACNDGYLLQHFLPRGIRVLGIEPAVNVGKVAESKGIPTVPEFLGDATGAAIRGRYGPADLVVANNVLAHTPAVNDFVAGLRNLLKEDGVLTIEFPHLLRLIEDNLFDTIYHEHFSYFSFFSAERVLAGQGLKIFDVDQVATHGGSLRLYARLATRPGPEESPAVRRMRDLEARFGITSIPTYTTFSRKVERMKRDLLSLLIAIRDSGKSIVGYGVPGKGNTLLNYCGLRTDFIDYMVDRNPYKQGKYTPGTRIPIFAPERIDATRPDFILIMPWNLRREIVDQLSYARTWGAKFIVPLPTIEILD